jgi:hypothetical protein
MPSRTVQFIREQAGRGHDGEVAYHCLTPVHESIADPIEPCHDRGDDVEQGEAVHSQLGPAAAAPAKLPRRAISQKPRCCDKLIAFK